MSRKQTITSALASAVTLCIFASTVTPAVSAELSHLKVGQISELQPITNFCGTKPLKVALSDGFGGNAWRKMSWRMFEAEAKKCPNITDITWANAQGNPERQVADVQSLAAQGYDIIVVYPDSGEALVRAMRKATQAGATVVPYATGIDYGGEVGKDYATFITADNVANAASSAEWLAKAMGGEGNIIVFGGTPGNKVSADEQKGWKPVFDKYPGIKVLESDIITNWDPAEYQRKTASLLAKYDQIDGIWSDYGFGVMGALRAFEAAGREIPPVAATDSNLLACYWYETKDKQPRFQFGTMVATTNWYASWALRKGLAAANGIDSTEPSVLAGDVVDDTLDPKRLPRCDKNYPMEIQFSGIGDRTPEEVQALMAE